MYVLPVEIFLLDFNPLRLQYFRDEIAQVPDYFFKTIWQSLEEKNRADLSNKFYEFYLFFARKIVPRVTLRHLAWENSHPVFAGFPVCILGRFAVSAIAPRPCKYGSFGL